LEKQYKLIIFDVDGTLVTTKSGATFRKSADDWQWLPGRLERLRELQGQGVKLALASNQGGVAFGYLLMQDVIIEFYKMMDDCQFDSIRICFYHPNASIEAFRQDSPMRKPEPGMLVEIMQEQDVSAIDTLMVGDRPEDEGAAKAAGIDFMWAKDFFGDSDERQPASH